MAVVSILDYGAGNVCSVKNAIRAAGYITKDIKTVQDIHEASILIFPGVGTFQHAMEFLHANHYITALRDYIKANRPYLGICLGMQTLFEGSEECKEQKGLGIIKGIVECFPNEKMTVPHIGWNGVIGWKRSALFSCLPSSLETTKLYFVHSYRAIRSEKNQTWVLTTTNYGESEFISSIQKGNVMATQFHPEKSGAAGISIIKGFLKNLTTTADHDTVIKEVHGAIQTQLSKRIIA